MIPVPQPFDAHAVAKALEYGHKIYAFAGGPFSGASHFLIGGLGGPVAYVKGGDITIIPSIERVIV